MKDTHICFIGAGSMAEAMLSGFLKKGLTPAERIHVINRSQADRLRELQKHYGITCPVDKGNAVAEADHVILAVKPKDMHEALMQWGSYLRPGQNVISVAAGIPTSFIEERIPAGISVIRAMPNTSSMIGLSATALCKGTHAREKDLRDAITMFSAIGSTVVVEEKDMDSVTGLSGSGPAYIYYLVEAMEQAGVRAGLSKQVARELTLQTLVGAAHMLMETGEEPSELRRRVTSPGGTTMAGLKALSDRGFHDALLHAVLQARDRAEELGRSLTISYR